MTYEERTNSTWEQDLSPWNASTPESTKAAPGKVAATEQLGSGSNAAVQRKAAPGASATAAPAQAGQAADDWTAVAMRPDLHDAPVQLSTGGPASGTQDAQAPASVASRPTLRMGSRGPDVQRLQELLNDKAGAGLVPDGDFGGKTHAAVVAFQRSAKLSPDGVVGANTWAALDGSSSVAAPANINDPSASVPSQNASTPVPGAPVPGAPAPAAPAASTGSRPTLRKGAFGDYVKLMQRQLNAAGAKLLVDGNFGAGTEKALMSFQSQHGITPSGACDDATWAALDAVAPIVMGPAERQPRDPRVDALMSGAYAGKGAYKPSGDGFADPDLDWLLHEYGRYWLTNTSAPAGVAKDGEPKGSTAISGGQDASGTAITAHPPWVADFQQKLIGEPKWTPDCEATQQLLQIYLNSWNGALEGGTNSSVEEFYRHVGKSETNNNAKGLGGFKGASNWCAEASTRAAIVGLLRKGVRFKNGNQASRLEVELSKQISGFVAWQKAGNGRQIAGPEAHAAELQAGDIISLVGHGPLSGHVATVIEHVGDRIRYVSGNASGANAGDGAVKAEEVTREQPPPGYSYFKIAAVANAEAGRKSAESKYQKAEMEQSSAAAAGDYAAVEAAAAKAEEAESAIRTNQAVLDENPDLPTSRQDPRFRPGVHAPANRGTIWVVTIIKASRLNANLLTQDLSDQALAKEGLERCTPLEQAYPDYHLYGL